MGEFDQKNLPSDESSYLWSLNQNSTMQSITTKILACLVAVSLFACNGNAPAPETTTSTTETPTADTTSVANAAPATDGKVLTLNAMFVEFSLGDAEHYSFKDKAGKDWDFGGCEDASVKFSQELPEAEANETNQGWSSNKALQNKWFDLKYVIRQQPQYQDGPMGEVPVIVEAKQVQ